MSTSKDALQPFGYLHDCRIESFSIEEMADGTWQFMVLITDIYAAFCGSNAYLGPRRVRICLKDISSFGCMATMQDGLRIGLATILIVDDEYRMEMTLNLGHLTENEAPSIFACGKSFSIIDAEI